MLVEALKRLCLQARQGRGGGGHAAGLSGSHAAGLSGSAAGIASSSVPCSPGWRRSLGFLGVPRVGLIAMRALAHREHPCHERLPPLGEPLECHPPPDELVQDVLGAEHGEKRLGEIVGIEGGVGLIQKVGDVRAVGRLRPDVKAPVRWRRGVGGEEQVPVRLDVREQGPAEGDEASAGRGARAQRGRAANEGFLEGALRGLKQREGE